MNQYLKRSLLCVAILLSLCNLYAQPQRPADNIYAFSRLYGYVRFFHPSDEAAAIDWDRFAIYGTQKVEGCKSPQELRDTLRALFSPIAPSVQLFAAGEQAAFNKAALMVPGAANYKVIAWQHSGVDLGNPGGLYNSARTHRPIVKKVTRPGFASLSHFLDATPYRNKEFVFRGRVKMNDSKEGSGHLWVRVDKANGIGFFDNMDNRPITNNEWTAYEVKGVVDADAARINFGVFLQGKGALQFDDISLQVKEGGEWKEVYSNSFGEEEQNKEPKSLVRQPAGQGSFAVAVESDVAVQKYVSIKSVEQTEKAKGHTTLFDPHPGVGEVVEKEIGSGLKAVVPLALYGSEEQTFPAGNKAQLARLQAALQEIRLPVQKGGNLYTRLGDVVIAWNIFQHFYPYFEVVKTDWNTALKEAIASAYTDKTEVDFQKTLQRLTAKLKDGHGWVSLNTKAYYYPQFTWEWVEGELVVTQVGDSNLPLAVGDIVKTIDGRDAKDYFSEVHSRISAATDGYLRFRAQTESLMGDKDSPLKLTVVKADNASREVTVNRDTRSVPRPVKDTIKSLGNGVLYVNLDVAPSEAIEKAMPELEKSRVIIFDLRGYPRSNPGMIAHLLTGADTSTQWMKVPQVVYPDGEKIAGYQKHGWGMKPEKPHLKARVLFLIDGRAISYAESYMSFIEHYKLATIIGQPTAGTNGNVNPFMLPGGYYISWTGMWVQKHDGSQHHGVGIRPHVYVERTIRSVREGRDEFLEKALEIAGKPM